MQARIDRVIFNILCKDLATTAAFYRQLAGFEQTYTSDWYVILSAPELDGLELGLIDHVSEFVPRQAGGMAAGGYLTLVVDDVYEAWRRAETLGVDLIAPPTALDYGQTRALLRDPNGIVVDISTPTAVLAQRLSPEMETGEVAPPTYL